MGQKAREPMLAMRVGGTCWPGLGRAQGSRHGAYPGPWGPSTTTMRGPLAFKFNCTRAYSQFNAIEVVIYGPCLGGQLAKHINFCARG